MNNEVGPPQTCDPQNTKEGVAINRSPQSFYLILFSAIESSSGLQDDDQQPLYDQQVGVRLPLSLLHCMLPICFGFLIQNSWGSFI